MRAHVFPEYATPQRPPKLSRSDVLTLAGLTAVAGAAGLACVVAPPYLIQGQIQRSYPAPLFPAIRTAWENMAPVPTALSLFVLGVALGAAQPRFWWVAGGGTVALLPLAALAEMIVSPKSHNAWPIEFALYGVVGLAAVGGAAVGRLARRRFRADKGPL
jgi:hypothetical protein